MNTEAKDIRGPALTLVGALFLTGCVSLDPAADIAHASDLVAARTGAVPAWTSPWFEPAEHWDGVAPLSSDAAVRVALQNNRAIRREVETIVASRADVVQAHLLPNPVITFAFGFPTDGMGGDPIMLRVMQDFTWIWRRPAAIDAADAELQGRVLAVSDTALRLVAGVRRAHADVHFAERAVGLQRESISLIDQSDRLLRDRFDVGEASRLDLNRVELELRASEVDLADRESDLASAKRTLLEMLGRADAATDWSTRPDDPRAVALSADLDETRVMTLAQLQRLDVAAARALVDARLADVDLQTVGGLPDVAGGVGYDRNFSSRPAVFPGVAVTPKLFDDNSARLARAESELRQAQIEADRVRQAAIAETRRAWVELQAQQAVVASYETEILSLAESNLVLAQLAFDAGETDLTVFLEAQRRLNDARIELTDRQLAVAGLVIELERAAGGALERESTLASRHPAEMRP